MNSICTSVFDITAKVKHRCFSTIHRFATLARVSSAIAISAVSTSVHAIPASERQALLDLYTSTQGASWINRSNWNGAAGTECTWYGVFCGVGGANVVQIALFDNHLTGSLPASLNQLTALEDFDVENNEIGGPIPSLSGLTALLVFKANGNLLTGSIPSLSGLSSLETFTVIGNRLSGTIPPLSGLTQLIDFFVNGNQLTGSLPALSGLTALTRFVASENQLTGAIPALTGLTELRTFVVEQNRLTGNLPSFAGLSNLRIFSAGYNQLTGNVVSLTGTTMVIFDVGANQLTGALPAAVGTLQNSASVVCPNFLTVTADAAWDTATGSTPWSASCTTAQPTQAMIFGTLPVLRVGGTGTVSVIVDPTPASGAAVVFSSNSPSVCTVDSASGWVTVSASAVVGSLCVIGATKAGDANFLPAPSLQKFIAVRAAIAPAAASAAQPVPALAFAALALLSMLVAVSGLSVARRKHRA
jgi:hypothetical protein